MGRAFEYRKAAKLKRWGHMAKTFTRLGKQIAIAVKAGGPDPDSNSTLRGVIATCKRENMPKDNIERAIKNALGKDQSDYKGMTYEGYGPHGIAVFVDTLTDNTTRTVADVRSVFNKFGGNLGTTGCVSFMFSSKGIIVAEADGKDEDTVMEDVFDAGASDFTMEDDMIEIETEPADFAAVRDALTDKGYKLVSADIEMIPATYTELTDEDSIKKMNLLLEHLEDNDDVQKVYHNWDMPDEEDED